MKYRFIMNLCGIKLLPFSLCNLGSLATLILPAAIYIKVMPSDSKMYWTSRVLLLFGFFVMIAVVAETVIKYAG